MNSHPADVSDVRLYVRALRRHWLAIGVCLAACLGASAFVTLQMTPMYRSTSQVFVSTSNSTEQSAYQGGLFSTQRVASYADAIEGRELAGRVAEDLGLDYSPSTLASRVEGEAVRDTVLLNIAVTDSDPRRAQQINKAYGKELAALVAELETPPGGRQPVLKATIIDSADRPVAPVSPNILRNLALAGILGLLIGIGITALREILDTTIKDSAAVAGAAGLAVAGRIDRDASVRKRPLVSQLGSHEPRTEAFRMLRTNLQYINIDGDGSKAYVVTSSLPGEGKSSTAMNLAISLAQTGQKILLIDADLRRPQVANILGLEPSVGLTTVLVGRIDVASAIQLSDAGMHVLTSGHLPPNPAELLQSRAMGTLLEELRERYDLIILDSPPLLPVTDAALLARIADGALLVVRHGRTTRDQLRHAVEQLSNVNAAAVGVVLNMVPNKRAGRNYGYGYGYGYGYAPEAGRRKRASNATKVAGHIDKAPGRRAETGGSSDSAGRAERADGATLGDSDA